jgi:hypothetical protein
MADRLDECGIWMTDELLLQHINFKRGPNGEKVGIFSDGGIGDSIVQLVKRNRRERG